MRKLLVVLISIVLWSCQPTTEDMSHVEVEHFGALRNFMHKGDISAKVDCSAFRDQTHFYALGALEDLQGEILILDSKVHNSTVEEDQVKLDSSFDFKASLFVSAIVPKWKTIQVPTEVKSRQALEDFISSTASSHGINTAEPFPFMLAGPVDALDWHVIKWDVTDKEHTHQKHVESGAQGTMEHATVTVLGFHSTKHQTIFTHHTSYVHMHVLNEQDEIAGHVDDIVLGPGVALKIPESKS